MSPWASPSEAVHHPRNVVGDNNDGMVIYSTSHLRYIIVYRFLSNFYTSSKLVENSNRTPPPIQIAILLQSFAMKKQNQHMEYEKLPVAYQKI